ncbi:HIT domain-containing protein [Bauldia litoralis]|uniref:Diadenosine tetraphosphate (Ap4A) hydrolase n=1 Tax=Bauldia litoralis TaxID=665467 RepID=A0A1G6E420_9HYPH|nr:HIT family protein [Bauldia litoralis]SDB52118.1 Diadenosine tetraphosphate (Ap4A) hydrolase [Bauldia litoralis]
MDTGFTLDERLAADSVAIGRLPLSDLLLARDARFPWLILVPRRPDMAEIIDLAPEDRAALLDEIVLVSEALRTVTGCDKLNVAALGNMVRQLHVHVIARFTTDPAWPGPIWGRGEAVAYEPGVRDKLAGRIRDLLPD